MDPSPPDVTYEPVRGTKIHLWEYDQFNDDDYLGSAITDNSGLFEFGPITENDFLGPDLYFTYYAVNEAAIVCDTFHNGTVYMGYSDTLNNLSPGDYNFYEDLSQDQSKPFFVADIVLDGYNEWKSVKPESDYYPWDTVKVQLNSGTKGAYYSGSYDFLYINDSIDINNRWPLTWNKGTILHEYAHRLSYMLNFF